MPDDKERGLYNKFKVERVDSSAKHNDCLYFVLDLTHDKHAIPAIAAYIKSCGKEFPVLADDLFRNVITR